MFLLKKFIKKRTRYRCFLCKYCETFKNTYFEEHMRTTASALIMTYYNHKVSKYWAPAGKSITWMVSTKVSGSGQRYQDFDGFRRGFCPLLNVSFSHVNKQVANFLRTPFLLVHLLAAATEIRRVSFLGIFFLWINLLCSIADV